METLDEERTEEALGDNYQVLKSRLENQSQQQCLPLVITLIKICGPQHTPHK